MRSLFRRLIVAGSCLALWAGCSAKQQTEYVTGISTQVTVPRDLKSVLVEVSISGVQQFCRAYRVYDGKVQLPRSLGTFAQNDPTASGPITYTIIGISEAYTDSSTNPLFDGTCTNLAIGKNNARILRRSRQPYVPEQILFLPMPLKYACVDKNCNDDQTCKGGTCVDATVAEPAKTFPRYTPDLSDGTGGTCFHVSTFKAPDGTTDLPGCMTAALPALTVDAGKCIYAVPNTADAPVPLLGQASPFTGPSSGDGVNVQVVFDGLVKEVLDLDPDEGFIVPDPTKPQQFKLAAGLCDMVKGTNGAIHQIADIRASGTCQAKRFAQPLCAADQNASMGLDPSGLIPTPAPAAVCQNVTLKPASAALMLVVDDSVKGASFFAALNKMSTDAVDNIVGQAVGAAFSNPLLANTKVGVIYTTTGVTPASPMCKLNLPPEADIPIAPITIDTAMSTFATIAARGINPENVADSDIGAGVKRAHLELAKSEYAADVVRAAIVFSNNFGSTDANCTESATMDATTAAALPSSPIQTYAMQVVSMPPVAPNTQPPPPADTLASAGGTQVSAYKVLGDFGAANKFKELIDRIDCTFEIPNPPFAVDGTEQLVYNDVQTGLAPSAMLPSWVGKGVCPTNPTDPEKKDGWRYEMIGGATRIRLCDAACMNYQTEVHLSFALGSLYGTSAPAVPINLRRAACAGQ